MAPPTDTPTSPPITDELLLWLDHHFPSQAPSLETPGRRVWFDAGSAHVVKRLREEQRRQRKGDA